MQSKKFIHLACAFGVVALSLSATGCKKEEKVAEPSSAAVQSATQQAAATTSATVVKEFVFDGKKEGWYQKTKNIKLSVATDQFHSGSGSLKLSGPTGVDSWNFAASPALKLEAGKRYRLSGWMLVDSTNNPKRPPFLKLAINDGTSFLSNANTKGYDLGKLQQWQELYVDFTAPNGQDLNGFIAVEKGAKDADIKATVYIDDIKLALVQ